MTGSTGERRQGRRDRPPADPVRAVTLQFHPDWPHGPRTVIESMAADRRYRSQFVTGISNGGLTAFPGGDRWRWESRLFSGRYDEAPPSWRPVYGAWNRRADPFGGAIRFGSSYVRLRPEAVRRSTFCFPDSVREPVHLGDAALLPRLCRAADESGLDDLDDYVEAQVHGPVAFSTDAEAVVLDPCYIGTDVESVAERLGCRIEFHPGFRASPDDIDPEYRGGPVVELARSLGPELTPRVLGDAARTGAAPVQTIKQVWHCLARFGRVGDGWSGGGEAGEA
ncbi:DUF3626 domain-containing protein [Serinibacter arcticus]|uniref:DUF3626 domain-containing protein n=1 Tax=Serinibacter arcticus TaxID=1655435 RepID=A0A2U1ZRX0_9MICO|nr:DUF3626 domain-containing protein [Serinibacter arcticus]PWD49701.1 DUF3626 domain-containing protein [Serinibacter arcticus]